MHPQVSIAYFVTSHGFGHAARASAGMDAIYDQWPFVRFEIFTNTREWFFQKSVRVPFGWHPFQTDVGLFQISSLDFDLDNTLAALEGFLPFDPEDLRALAGRLHQFHCLKGF